MLFYVCIYCSIYFSNFVYCSFNFIKKNTRYKYSHNIDNTGNPRTSAPTAPHHTQNLPCITHTLTISPTQNNK